MAVAIILFTFSPAEVPSATPQPHAQQLAQQLDLRRVNARNQKVLSRAIHVTFSSPKIGGVVCEISSKEHEGPSSLVLKAPHKYTLDTKAVLFSAEPLILLSFTAVLLYPSWWVWGDFGRWMVYYCYCFTAVS